MTFILPNLSLANCTLLSICSSVSSDKKEVNDWLKEDRCRHYIAQTPYGRLYARLVLESEDSHCHVDLALPSYFADGPPDEGADFTELVTDLGPLAGEQVSARIRCDFTLPFDNLPQIVKYATKMSRSENGITVKQTAGTFSIEGALVRTVKWNVDEEEGTAGLTIKGRSALTINENWFTDAFDLIKDWYYSFIKPGTPNVNGLPSKT